MDNQLKDKISSRMTQVGIGECFGISSQAVGKWLRKGKIPHGRILPLCRILEWQVSKTISCLVENMSTVDDVTTFTVSEMPDWSFENPRAILRYQDGTASGLMVTTRVGNFGVSVPHLTDFDNIIIGNPSIEPPRLIFCESTSAGYNAIVSEISPQSDGTCQVTAKEYRDSFYDYDNAAYPGDVA